MRMSFITLHHLLQAAALAAKDWFKQLWTSDQVPDGTLTRHNFKDGKGKVPAVPYDEVSTGTGLANVVAKDGVVNGEDDAGVSSTLYRFTVRQVLVDGSDAVSPSMGVANVTCDPQPIVIEVTNDVQAIIDHIVPVKTQALPGQDHEFHIYYKEGYSYVEGDITTNYGTISKDGKILTVNSMYDLTVRLILSPDPQGWDKGKPSPSTKQTDYDVLLDVIPHDGQSSAFKIDYMCMSYYFYYYYKYNTASNMVTNVTNGSSSTTSSGTSTIDLTYASGYDYHDIDVWIYDTASTTPPADGWSTCDESVHVHERCAVLARWNREPSIDDQSSGDQLATDRIIGNKLSLTNITDNFYIKFTPNSRYTDPIVVDDPRDATQTTYSLDSVSLEDYFRVVKVDNKITEYCKVTSSNPTTPLVGAGTTFDFSYTTGYDMVDTTATCSNPDISIRRVQSIDLGNWTSHDGLTIPDDYNVIAGITNTSNATYFKTGYIPAAGDRVVCYATVNTANTNSYAALFGARTSSDGNRSMIMWTRWSGSNVFAYDRCKVNIHTTGVYNLVSKIECTDTAASIDYSYSTTTIANSASVLDSAYEAYLFNRNSNNSYNSGYSTQGTIYRFTAYGADGSIKCEMVPVTRKSDNMAGFFNTVTQVFYSVATGTVSPMAALPISSRMYISNITSDCTIEITKNDNARRKLALDEFEHDAISSTYTIDDISMTNWFNYVRVKNNATAIATCSGSTYDSMQYNTVGTSSTTTRFALAYKNEHDDAMLAATTNNDAVATLEECMHIEHPIIPDEYYGIPGVLNDNTSTYFRTGYYPKPGDKFVCYFMTTNNGSYNRYLFGCNDSNANTASVMFSSQYDSTYKASYRRCSAIVQTSGELEKSKVYRLTCTDTGCSIWNGYDTTNLSTSGTINESTRELYVFGLNDNGNWRYSMAATSIYRFTVRDQHDIPVLDLIPAVRKSDNAVGFYDNVGDRFIIPASGSVTTTSTPTLYGRLSVTNVTEDTTVTLSKCDDALVHTELPGDTISNSLTLDAISMEDWFYPVTVNNQSASAISLTGYTYGNQCTARPGGTVTLTPVFSAGYASNNFVVTHGVLTNTAWTISNVQGELSVTVALDTWHAPASSGDDLGIFTDTVNSEYDQYVILRGNDTSFTDYSFITGEPSTIGACPIYAIAVADIDLVTFDPTGIPGEKIRTQVINDGATINETITTTTVGDATMYKHTFTLPASIRFDSAYQYLMKVRSVNDTSCRIAVASGTGGANLGNGIGVPVDIDGKMYFEWGEANRYVIAGNHTIYVELNGRRQ